MDHDITLHSVLSYIESHAAQHPSVAGLSRLTGYSPSRLRELFAAGVGVSLSRYIASRRVANAAFDILCTGRDLMDVALDYHYDSYDTFTRAFRRMTGLSPSQFKRKRPSMQRRLIASGLYGVFITDGAITGKEDLMMKKTFHEKDATILYDVPRISYGAYGGVTPYPICLKASANYMGEDVDYADALVSCGAAFRLTWDTEKWDGGNVDVRHTFDDAPGGGRVYTEGMTRLGRASTFLGLTKDAAKSDVQAFLVEALDGGSPVIAMGMVGPPEAGIVCGYRKGGDEMLGWGVFQDYDFYKQTLSFDDCGYYISDTWWENGVDALIVMGEKTREPAGPGDIAALALEVMAPRRFGPYAKGLLAYDAWKKMISDEGAFDSAEEKGEAVTPDLSGQPETRLKVLEWAMMTQGDAMDCLADGRPNAARYFARHAGQNPLYGQIAACFEQTGKLAMAMYDVLGGFYRGEKETRAFADPGKRRELCRLIDEAKASDSAAYELLGKAAGK